MVVGRLEVAQLASDGHRRGRLVYAIGYLTGVGSCSLENRRGQALAHRVASARRVRHTCPFLRSDAGYLRA